MKRSIITLTALLLAGMYATPVLAARVWSTGKAQAAGEQDQENTANSWMNLSTSDLILAQTLFKSLMGPEVRSETSQDPSGAIVVIEKKGHNLSCVKTQFVVSKKVLFKCNILFDQNGTAATVQ